MLAKYRRTRNKRRRMGAKKQRTAKRSQRSQRRRRTYKQKGGNFGLTNIPDSALVDHKSMEDDGFYAPMTMTYKRHAEVADESERA
jgi:hypothetical protein